MNNLRSKLIRLAYRKPELRRDLLPLILKKAAARMQFKPEFDFADKVQVSKALFGVNVFGLKPTHPEVVPFIAQLTDIAGNVAIKFKSLLKSYEKQSKANAPNDVEKAEIEVNKWADAVADEIYEAVRSVNVDTASIQDSHPKDSNTLDVIYDYTQSWEVVVETAYDNMAAVMNPLLSTGSDVGEDAQHR